MGKKNERTQPRVAVVIPAHNEARAENLVPALGALSKQTVEHKVIVVADACDDTTAAVAASMDAAVVETDTQGRPGVARNIGADEAIQAYNADIIVFMDADCRPPRWWLTLGLEYFTKRSVGMLSGPVFFAISKSKYETLMACLLWLGQSTVITSAHWVLKALRRGAVGTGANIFVRAHVFEKVKGFPTDARYMEEFELARNIAATVRNANLKSAKTWKVFYRPTLTIRTSPRRIRSDGVVRQATIYFGAICALLLGSRTKRVFKPL